VNRLLSLLALLALSACAHQPTLSDAQDYLHEGDPANAMFAARQAARAAPPEERPAIWRVAFEAALEAGWSDAAAQEYLALREHGGDDDALLTDLAERTLRLALCSQDPARRLRATHALRALSDPAEVGALVSLALDDRQAEVRAAAVALAFERDVTVVDAIALLADEPAASVRLALVVAAGSLTGEAPLAALDLAQASLQDPDASVRRAAVELLGALADLDDPPPAVHTGLRSALWDGSDAVVRAAARHLAARFGPADAWTGWSDASLPVDGQGALASCARVLAWRAGQGRLAAVEAALASPTYHERLAALEALGPAVDALEPTLMGLLTHDPALRVRLASLEAFALAGRADRLQALLTDPDPALRRQALRALDRLQPLSPAQLTSLLERGDPALIDVVATLLAQRGGDSGRRALVASLARPSVVAPALRALNTLTDPRLREPYLELLAHRDPEVRSLAGRGLVRCGLRDDRPALVHALLDLRGAADLTAAAALLSIQRHGAPRRASDAPATE
jgi:HEAT repeat protein